MSIVKSFPSQQARKSYGSFCGLLISIDFSSRIWTRNKDVIFINLRESSISVEWLAWKNLFKIKEKYSEALELVIPDIEIEFTVETDESDYGFGAILKQDGKIVAFASRLLNKSEKNYGKTKKE